MPLHVIMMSDLALNEFEGLSQETFPLSLQKEREKIFCHDSAANNIIKTDDVSCSKN